MFFRSIKKPGLSLLTAGALFFTLLSPSLAEEKKDEPDLGNMPPCMSWVNPLMKPRVVLLCIHGLGLYSRSYADFAQRISKFGVAVYAIDVRGFGSWMKAEGHTELDFKSCIEDIRSSLIAIRKANPGLPVFLLGESMGGAIALRAAATYPDLVNGLISSVPAGERFQSGRTDLKVAAKFLTGPNRQFNIGKQVVKQASDSKAKDGTVNEQLMDSWESDPLDRMHLSAKELLQFDVFCKGNRDYAEKVTSMPVLFVQGIDDALIRPDGTWDLYKKLATPDRTFLAVSSRHLIFEQAQDNSKDVKDTSIFMVLSWLATNIPDGRALVAGAVARPRAALGSALSGSGPTDDTTVQIPEHLRERLAAVAPPGAMQGGMGRAGAGMRRRQQAARRRMMMQQGGMTQGIAQGGGDQTATADANTDSSAVPGFDPQKIESLISQGQFDQARQVLTQVQSADPTNPDLHYLLGMIAMRSGRRDAARSEFVNAMRLGRGIGHSRQANRFLLSMMNNNNANAGAATVPNADKITGGKPTVLAFYADWAEQCDQLDDLFSEARKQFGQDINLVKVDVASESSDELLKTFDVGPIPTMVFLSRNGKVVSTSIGQSSFANFAKALSMIVN